MDIGSLAEFDQMTIREYEIRVKALRLKEVDKDYRIHMQAFLNYSVQAQRKAGKNKTKPVYSKFKKFFDYEKAIREAKGEDLKDHNRFTELSRFMKGKMENG